jgi:hypothetical protein
VGVRGAGLLPARGGGGGNMLVFNHMRKPSRVSYSGDGNVQTPRDCGAPPCSAVAGISETA